MWKSNCKNFYLGVTTRRLKKRYQEHMQDFKYGKQKSYFSDHIKQQNDISPNINVYA